MKVNFIKIALVYYSVFVGLAVLHYAAPKFDSKPNNDKVAKIDSIEHPKTAIAGF